MEAERTERWQIAKPAARGEYGVVTAQHYSAAEAGAAILEAGGNAVDAAVAAGLSLQTCEPWMTSLAACGYMMIAEPDGSVEAIEFTGKAPAKIDPGLMVPDPHGGKTFLGMPAAKDLANIKGYSAVCVPGCVRGFELALARHGSFAWDRVLQPAIDRARKGIYASWHSTLAIAIAEDDLRRDPGASAIFLPRGAPPEPGERLSLLALTRTLERLAEAGPDDFYTGRIAEQLGSDLRDGGSSVSLEDLAAYRASAYPASARTIAGRTVHTAGDSSGGQRLHETLAYFDAHRGAGPVDAGFYTSMVEALRKAFAGHRARNDLPKDAPAPAELAKAASTTHVNVIDREGRMVALTFTLLQRFGARVLSPSTGVLLNNGMAWFDIRPGRLDSLRPSAPGRNNMCPVAITDADGPVAVLGAAGGNQIVPTLAQLTSMFLHAGLNVEEAMNLPRMTTGAVQEITVDLDMPAETIAALKPLGPLKLAERGVYPRPFASPGMASREGKRFAGMPDTTYPSSQAIAPGKPSR